jgi:hypothetical protein
VTSAALSLLALISSKGRKVTSAALSLFTLSMFTLSLFTLSLPKGRRVEGPPQGENNLEKIEVKFLIEIKRLS